MKRLLILPLLLILILLQPARAPGAADTSFTSLSSALLSEAQALLPESSDLLKKSPEWVNPPVSPNLQLAADARVKLVFLDEGAGYRNAFGYFTYDNAGKVLTTTTIFENASEKGGGGDLVPGDTVDLGKFPAGTNIGFWLIADGYSKGYKLPAQAPADSVFYSREALNPKSERHVALVAMRSRLGDGSLPLVMGFEDLPIASGDRDFNDAVFMLLVTPEEAISAEINAGVLPVSKVAVDSDNDGVTDDKDAFPTDAKRCYKTRLPAAEDYYTVAFEDSYPDNDDNDYNDLVVAFSLERVTDCKGKLIELRAKYSGVARGSKKSHSFRHRLQWTGKKKGKLIGASSVVTRYDASGKNTAVLKGTHASGGADLEIFEDTLEDFKDKCSKAGLFNTEPGRPQVEGSTTEVVVTFDDPIDLEEIDAAPFDPYIIKKDTKLDLHLCGKSPLSDREKKDLEVLKTGKDDGYYYDEDRRDDKFRTGDKHPAAMVFSKSWSYPVEGVSVDSCYARYKECREKDLAEDWSTSAKAGVRSFTVRMRSGD